MFLLCLGLAVSGSAHRQNDALANMADLSSDGCDPYHDLMEHSATTGDIPTPQRSIGGQSPPTRWLSTQSSDEHAFYVSNEDEAAAMSTSSWIEWMDRNSVGGDVLLDWDWDGDMVHDTVFLTMTSISGYYYLWWSDGGEPISSSMLHLDPDSVLVLAPPLVPTPRVLVPFAPLLIGYASDMMSISDYNAATLGDNVDRLEIIKAGENSSWLMTWPSGGSGEIDYRYPNNGSPVAGSTPVVLKEWHTRTITQGNFSNAADNQFAMISANDTGSSVIVNVTVFDAATLLAQHTHQTEYSGSSSPEILGHLDRLILRDMDDDGFDEVLLRTGQDNFTIIDPAQGQTTAFSLNMDSLEHSSDLVIVADPMSQSKWVTLYRPYSSVLDESNVVFLQGTSILANLSIDVNVHAGSSCKVLNFDERAVWGIDEDSANGFVTCYGGLDNILFEFDPSDFILDPEFDISIGVSSDSNLMHISYVPANYPQYIVRRNLPLLPATHNTTLLSLYPTGNGMENNVVDTDKDGLSDRFERRIGRNPLIANPDGDELIPAAAEVITHSDILVNDSDVDFDGDGLSAELEARFGTRWDQSDPDQDGLNDSTEVLESGTSPYLNDTDGDLLFDLFEWTKGTLPLIPDHFGDPDGDGLLNYEEQTYNTYANNSDSDGDGLKDGEETRIWYTNPLLEDTDFDNITDGLEVAPNPYVTNPLLSDTDSDDLSDWKEITITFTNPGNADTDGDTVPDGTELQYGLDPNVYDADQDLDDDGLNASQEIIYGTELDNNDTDADGLEDGYEVEHGSLPTLADSDQDGLSDYEELIEYGTNPMSSDSDTDGIPDLFELDNNLDPNNATDASLDRDGDGLSNFSEYTQHTNLDLTDTDGDGLPDGWEVVNSTDPLNDDTNIDLDGDGLTNMQEFEHNTFPNVFDTDADDMSDGWEVKYGLNPVSSADGGTDLDHDGLDNEVEYDYDLDPTNPDTDADGMPDGWEIENSLNARSSHDRYTDNDNDLLINFREYELNTDPHDNDLQRVTMEREGITGIFMESLPISINIAIHNVGNGTWPMRLLLESTGPFFIAREYDPPFDVPQSASISLELTMVMLREGDITITVFLIAEDTNVGDPMTWILEIKELPEPRQFKTPEISDAVLQSLVVLVVGAEVFVFTKKASNRLKIRRKQKNV